MSAAAADQGGQFEGNWLLRTALQTAVPMEITVIAGWTFEQRKHAADRWVQLICEQGDVLQYGGKGCGAFTALARGLTALAHQLGDVTFAGLHWCAGSGDNGARDQAPCQAEIDRDREEQP